jgi:hypothetical protein
MISISTSLFTVTSLLLLVGSSSPVAVIEDVRGKPAGLQVMDYVEPGEVIQLGSNDSIVLDYLTSCWRETITGGTVTVGTEESDVVNGKIERSRVECQANNKAQVDPALADRSGGMIFRGNPRLTPQVTLYGLSPIIEVTSRDTLVIERIDRPGKPREISLSGEQLVHNKFLDLAKTGVVLTAGAIYRAKAGTQEIVFKIDPKAKPGQTPIVGRLLRLHPAD